MTEVLQRYKIVLIILGMIVLLMIAGFLLLTQHSPKIPSRGVFVSRLLSQFTA